ncbi:MAG: hypothetical protein ACRDN9_17635 [Streptosporangiaceae bacterium]
MADAEAEERSSRFGEDAYKVYAAYVTIVPFALAIIALLVLLGMGMEPDRFVISLLFGSCVVCAVVVFGVTAGIMRRRR